MAQVSLGTSLPGGAGVVDKRKTQTNASPISATLFNATRDIASLDAALIAANAAYYTQARLDTMTRNDKVYALRIINDLAGI